MEKAVTLQPCLGLNSLESTIGRQACYAVAEDMRPGKINLGCSPALYARVWEDIHFIEAFPVIAVESCEKACANKIIREEFGQTVTRTLYVQDILKEAGFLLEGKPRKEIEPIASEPVQIVARKIAEEVDRLLSA
ncbi:MAG: hypothetical protein IT210_06385 [Armatimonadetes bacterium]|nr:hypothetical protein [Armatimonadota bacterium]